ncbi:MAG: hypothetical protein U0002_22485 [Thermoanaerobaculia bacterium]
MSRTTFLSSIGPVAAILLAAALPLQAIEPPENAISSSLLFRAPELQISELSLGLNRVPAEQPRASRLVSSAELAQLDLRTDRFLTLATAVPLLPGAGVGNSLSWADRGQAEPKTNAELAGVAWQALKSWLVANRAALRINPSELADPPRVTVLSPNFVQIYIPRRVAGLPVRDSYLTATLRYGNLVLFGATNWGDVTALPTPSLSANEAIEALARRAAPFPVGQAWKASELAWVPVATASSLTATEAGTGLGYRLAWVIRTDFGEASGRYEALVDAARGEVLSIQDTKSYVATSRVIEGGVYPISNDNVAPDGVEQADWPMPFSSVTTPSGSVATDIGGNLPACVDGSISTGLAGTFLAMSDTCGVASLSGTGDLDFGTSTGTDCTTPGVGGAGNTHASRSGYFEINMIKAMARGQLPNNAWLTQQLTANMNITQTCNANWNGATVNFFRSGGGCNNTGELAGVFDHEWGHGMDNNDAVPTVSFPGEGIADVYASLRLDDSCMGRNFRATACGGYGNPCTTCTGVRDIDWDKHTGHAPFTMANADACGPGNSNGPCGGSVHCEGQVYSQAVWDLWNRDLVGGTFNFNLDVAREMATQLTYRGASGVGTWFACTPGSGGCGNPAGCGCAATSGYQQYLTADDDNGNLADGTPHMQALFDAFSRHGIACTTPTVTTAGCSGTPTEVPVVTATAQDRGVALSWTASTGATGYRVYRSDGVFSCSFGKQLLATVSGTSYVDSGLKNGRSYYYQVVPMGTNDECFAVASTCTTATPVSGANVTGVAAQATVQMLTGDSDPFLDNCETARVTLPVSNIGSTTLTNVRILNVTSPSHPSTTFVTTFPSAITPSLTSCANVNATFDFVGGGLTAGSPLTFDVELTSDELAPGSRMATVSFVLIEGDFQNFATKTFNFDTTTEGWTTVMGTFLRDNAGGGANSTPFYMRSSTFLDNQCDVVRSPVIRLNSNSTMTLSNNLNIETMSGGQWWDRANIGIRPIGSETRTLVTPSTGRLYNASGIGGTCGTENQAGWAGVNATWATSTWDATALQSATFATQPIQLEVRYGTDSSVNNFGFRVDEVQLTNVDVQVADAQSDVCTSTVIFLDGFESGNTSAWAQTVP